MAPRTHTSADSPGAGRRFPGTYLGVVTRVDDPRKLGRVKVRVPEIAGQHELAWARVKVPLAGTNLGAFFVPAANTLVHVEFEADDGNRPIVTGAAYVQVGEKSTIPLAAQGEADPIREPRGTDVATGAHGSTIVEPANPSAPTYPNNQVIKTAAGHLLELDNTPGAERIGITHGPSKTWIEFHPDGTLVAGVKGKRYTLVELDDEVHVKGAQHVVVDGDASQSSGIFDRFCERYGLVSMSDITAEATGFIHQKGQTFTVEAVVEAVLKSLLVKLGPGPAQGDVHTTLTHPVDYITGLPIPGTPFVKAG